MTDDKRPNKRADGTQYVLPHIDATDGETLEERIEKRWQILRQCEPGAIVTYPDGSRYKVPRKADSYYICEDTGEKWRVVKLRKISDEP